MRCDATLFVYVPMRSWTRVAEIHYKLHSKLCVPIRSNATLPQNAPRSILSPWAHVAMVSSGGLSMVFPCVPVYVLMRSKSWASFWIWGGMGPHAFWSNTCSVIANCVTSLYAPMRSKKVPTRSANVFFLIECVFVIRSYGSQVVPMHSDHKGSHSDK